MECHHAIFLITLILTASCAWKEVQQKVSQQDDFSGKPLQANCDEYFHGQPWPLPMGVADQGAVKLCQNQKKNETVVFATLFSTKDRIPIYTANKVVLKPEAHTYPRPESYLWYRVSLTLCDIQDLPTYPIFSMIGHIAKHLRDGCGKYQALTEDYEDNPLDLERGHLSPNSINSQNQVKQDATFTLTNAAPQFGEFNKFSWREYECVTQHTILELVPNEEVFIMTGTYGTAYDQNHKPLYIEGNKTNPVKVPGFYWKLVCYPGNQKQGKEPWAYAIIQANTDIKKTASAKSYMTVKEFANKYFVDPPVGDACLNAPFGAFGKYLNVTTFAKFLNLHCDVAYEQINGSEKMEL